MTERSRQPWLKFYPADWRQDPALRMCSLAARGLWIEMLCLMWQADPRGSLLVNGKQITPRQLAPLVGAAPREVDLLFLELEEAGVFSRDEDGTVFSRRMRREVEKSERDRISGSDGGAPNVRRGRTPKHERVRPYRKSDAPEKTARILAKAGGHCFWCETALVTEIKVETDHARFFHVDHLLPVCDGGTNDESNLVAACATCNHDRSKVGWPETSRRGVNPTLTRKRDPTLSRDGVGKSSDSKAQKPEARSQKPEAAAAASGGGRMSALEAECRRLVEPEPVMLAQDFHTIADLLDAGVTADDIRIGITEALARRSDRKHRYRTWSQIAGWCRTAAKNRLANGPPAAPGELRPTRDNPDDPRVDFGGGVSAPISTIRLICDRGAWIDDWGPRPGEPGCRVPAELLEEASA